VQLEAHRAEPGHMAYDHGGLKASRRKPSGGRKREK
jgi:hypothetical protein